MVGSNDPWDFLYPTSEKPPDLNCMNPLLPHSQENCAPARINPGALMLSELISSPGFTDPVISNPISWEASLAYGSPHCLPSILEALLPASNASLFPYKMGANYAPEVIDGTFQKKRLIFDKFEDRMRSIHRYGNPQLTHGKNLAGQGGVFELHRTELPVIPSQLVRKEHTLDQTFHENQQSEEESEMHEDTEEIDALLYSTDDDEYESEEDDVTSTGHSPSVVEGSFERCEQLDEIAEEVASSDGPNKRQKILCGGYHIPFLNTTSVKPERSISQDHDTESRFDTEKNGRVGKVSYLGSTESGKDKIRRTLKLLESIVPSAKGQEPLVVLDEAIDYLKAMRHKAEILGKGFL